MLLTEDEARRTWGDDMEQYWDYAVGGYRARFVLLILHSNCIWLTRAPSVSFTHTLHCLVDIPVTSRSGHPLINLQNWLRVMNSTQLQLIEAGEEPQPHHAHCIGQIRQYIM